MLLEDLISNTPCLDVHHTATEALTVQPEASLSPANDSWKGRSIVFRASAEVAVFDSLPKGCDGNKTGSAAVPRRQAKATRIPATVIQLGLIDNFLMFMLTFFSRIILGVREIRSYGLVRYVAITAISDVDEIARRSLVV